MAAGRFTFSRFFKLLKGMCDLRQPISVDLFCVQHFSPLVGGFHFHRNLNLHIIMITSLLIRRKPEYLESDTIGR